MLTRPAGKGRPTPAGIVELTTMVRRPVANGMQAERCHEDALREGPCRGSGFGLPTRRAIRDQGRDRLIPVAHREAQLPTAPRVDFPLDLDVTGLVLAGVREALEIARRNGAANAGALQALETSLTARLSVPPPSRSR